MLGRSRQILVVIIQQAKELGVDRLATEKPRVHMATPVEPETPDVMPFPQSFDRVRRSGVAVDYNDRKDQPVLVFQETA